MRNIKGFLRHFYFWSWYLLENGLENGEGGGRKQWDIEKRDANNNYFIFNFWFFQRQGKPKELITFFRSCWQRLHILSGWGGVCTETLSACHLECVCVFVYGYMFLVWEYFVYTHRMGVCVLTRICVCIQLYPVWLADMPRMPLL